MKLKLSLALISLLTVSSFQCCLAIGPIPGGDISDPTNPKSLWRIGPAIGIPKVPLSYKDEMKSQPVAGPHHDLAAAGASPATHVR